MLFGFGKRPGKEPVCWLRWESLGLESIATLAALWRCVRERREAVGAWGCEGISRIKRNTGACLGGTRLKDVAQMGRAYRVSMFSDILDTQLLERYVGCR